jgi:hypothetical protein
LPCRRWAEQGNANYPQAIELKVFEVNMRNEDISLGSESAPKDTVTLISTYIAGTKVNINPGALKQLVETLRIRLQS